MKPAVERRKNRRHRLSASHGALELSLDGTVLDISVSGMSIESRTRLNPRSRIALRLNHQLDALALNGRVVWCFLQGTQPDEEGNQQPLYRAGIEFENVLQPEAQRLAAFLSSRAIVTLETRLFGRFHVRGEQGVDVSSSADFRVLGLAETTLLVETSLAVDPQPGALIDLHLAEPEVSVRGRVLSYRRLGTTEDSPLEVEVELVALSEEEGARLAEFRRRALEAIAGA